MTIFINRLSPILQAPALSPETMIDLFVIIISLALVMLIEKEFIRSYGTEHIRAWFNTFDVFTWATLVIFAFIIVSRLLGFIFN